MVCFRVELGIIDEGKAHMLELAQLAEKDPEFYKYLQENDRELLEFEDGEEDISVDEEEEGPEVPEDKVPRLTMAILKKWQKALLEVRFRRLMLFTQLKRENQKQSLRALRRMLIAFRSAARMNEEDQVLAWKIDNSEGVPFVI